MIGLTMTYRMTKMQFLGTKGKDAMVECTDALPPRRTTPGVIRAVGGGFHGGNRTEMKRRSHHHGAYR